MRLSFGFQSEKYQKYQHEILHLITNISSASVNEKGFAADETVKYDLFNNKVVSGINEKFAKVKIMEALEATEDSILHDVVGYGSNSDLDDLIKE